MDKLIRQIKAIQAKLDGLRKLSLKETPTRTIIIDPLLEALGWDVRDPDEVQLEYTTVDGKSVDYALLINGKPRLLVEAKPLDDALNDVKGITQVVGYAANAGIAWCVLTNGIVWRVYRSVEECPAPDKLMSEVSLDPREDDALAVEQIAPQMWRLISRDEVAKGTLDDDGEHIFTDSKVRKALDTIMRDAPLKLLNVVKAAAHNGQLTPKQIKASLARIWGRISPPEGPKPPAGDGPKPPKPPRADDDSRHTEGKPKEVVELYWAINRTCLSLKPGHIERRCRAVTINYQCDKAIFCCVELQKRGLRVCLKLKYNRLQSPPPFARDVSGVGHFGEWRFAASNSRHGPVGRSDPTDSHVV